MSTFSQTRQVPEDGVLDRASCARRGLLLFFAIFIPLSLLFDAATFISISLLGSSLVGTSRSARTLSFSRLFRG